jgi:protein-S-isoprenylcysteine O-methyltransferase Ste14
MNSSYNKRVSAVAALAWLIPAFAILEPVWMLTPFVGFLYGSVLNLSWLEAQRSTAWLLLFVLPARGIGLPGLILTAAGLGLFAAGAGQVYTAKFKKKGMVTGGVYRILRHPQYTGLILAAAGLVLLWSRMIAFLSLFVMVFLYFLLSLKEEAACRKRFGAAYDTYRRQTLGIFPGSSTLARMAQVGPVAPRVRPMTAALGLLLSLGLALGSGFAILKARQAFAADAPLYEHQLSRQGRPLRLVTPRSPYLEAGGRRGLLTFQRKQATPGMFFETLAASQKIASALKPFEAAGMNAVLLVFDPRLSVRRDQDRTRFSFYMVPADLGAQAAEMGPGGFRRNARLLGLLTIDNMAAGSEPEPVPGAIRAVTAQDMRHSAKARHLVENKVAVFLSRFY